VLAAIDDQIILPRGSKLARRVIPLRRSNVRFWHKADVIARRINVRFWG
jgi:hypothetical protein